jgi:hypothetical protein
MTDQNQTAAPEIDATTALLIRARGFLERGWCRGVFALDAHGRQVAETSDQAVAWCAIGALLASGMPRPLMKHPAYSRHPAMRRLQAAIGNWRNVGNFNNRQETVEPVLAAFDAAIAMGDH